MTSRVVTVASLQRLKWRLLFQLPPTIIRERKFLRKILGPVNENGMCGLRYNDEIYNLYSEPNIVNIIKVGRSRWIGHVMRIEEDNATRRLTLLRPDG